MDLIKTIEENAEVQDFSEDSDVEVEVCDLINIVGVKLIFDIFDLTGSVFRFVFRCFPVSTDKSQTQKERRIQW